MKSLSAGIRSWHDLKLSRKGWMFERMKEDRSSLTSKSFNVSTTLRPHDTYDTSPNNQPGMFGRLYLAIRLQFYLQPNVLFEWTSMIIISETYWSVDLRAMILTCLQSAYMHSPHLPNLLSSSLVVLHPQPIWDSAHWIVLPEYIPRQCKYATTTS